MALSSYNRNRDDTVCCLTTIHSYSHRLRTYAVMPYTKLNGGYDIIIGYLHTNFANLLKNRVKKYLAMDHFQFRTFWRAW